MKILVLLSTQLLSGILVLAFSQERRLEYAKSMYEKEAYYYASEGFEDVIDRKVDSLVVGHLIADCYYHIGHNSKAIAWYRYLDMKEELASNELMRLALLEHQAGNARQSEMYFKLYEQKHGSNAITENYLDPNRFDLKLNEQVLDVTLIEQPVNGTSSEIGAMFYQSKNEVLIASNRREKFAPKRLQGYTGDYLYHFYIATVDSSGILSNFSLLDTENELLKDNLAIGSFSAKQDYIYFSKNRRDYDDKGNVKKRPMQIYRAKVVENDLREVEYISFEKENYSFMNPFVTPSGERMYFASDMPGGFGGMDLYYVVLDEQGNFNGDPINLGEKINTGRDELSPFVDEENNRLFFSSDGHYGFGGLDVFMVQFDKQNKNIKKVQNVGAPLNSSADDFSFTISPTGELGFVSSNRAGGSGEDDIYGFRINSAIEQPKIIKGSLVSEFDGDPIPGLTLFIKDSSGVLLDSIITDDEGIFEFQMDSESGSFLNVENNTFEKKSFSLDIIDLSSEEPFELELTPLVEVKFIGTVEDMRSTSAIEGARVSIRNNHENSLLFDTYSDASGKFVSEAYRFASGDTLDISLDCQNSDYKSFTEDFSVVIKKDTLISLNIMMLLRDKQADTAVELSEKLLLKPIHFDFNSAVIKAESEGELNKVLDYLKHNPTVRIEIQGHTDNRGSDSYNMQLSEKRANSVKKFLVAGGIDADRLDVKAFGEDKPIYTGEMINSEKDLSVKNNMHRQNRRTNFLVTGSN